MKARILKLAGTISTGLGAVIAALVALPAAVDRIANPIQGIVGGEYLVQFTTWATAPSTIGEMSTEVSTFATTVMPNWTVYVVAALIFSLTAWLIGRFIRSMRSG